MTRFIKSLGQFWYDFIIGDDWKIAAAVVGALLITLAGLLAKLLGTTGATVFGAITLLLGFTSSLVVDVRRSRSHR